MSRFHLTMKAFIRLPSFSSYSSWDEILLSISVSSWSKVSRWYIETILILMIWSWQRNAASHPMPFIANVSIIARRCSRCVVARQRLEDVMNLKYKKGKQQLRFYKDLFLKNKPTFTKVAKISLIKIHLKFNMQVCIKS